MGDAAVDPLQEGIDVFLREADAKATDALNRAGRLDSLAMQLGILTTVLASIATLTALPDDITKWVTAVTAFFAALVSGILTTIKPQEKARELRAQEVEWRELSNWARRLSRQLRQQALEAGEGGRYSRRRVEDELERCEFARDNLRRKIAGLDPLPEPHQVAVQAESADY